MKVQAQEPSHPKPKAAASVRPLMTVKEVAERLNVSVFMIYSLADKKVIPPIYIGRHRRFEWDDVEKYIERQKRAGRPRRRP